MRRHGDHYPPCDAVRGRKSRSPRANLPTRAGRRPRLVIADDDPVVQLMLSASLGLDFEGVGLANDGEETIEVAGAKQPDAALVDVVMPKGGGLRAVRGILEAAPNTAVVMISGRKPKRMVRQLLKLGAIGYCRKGLDPRLLPSHFVSRSSCIQLRVANRPGWFLRGTSSRLTVGPGQRGDVARRNAAVEIRPCHSCASS
jgi:CheY-like chemotaxis protein